MPAFLKDLRRRSRASFRRSPSHHDLSNGQTPANQTPVNQSTLSLNSSSFNHSAPGSIPSEGSVGSAANGRNADGSIPPVPPRPNGNLQKRYSLHSNLTTSPIFPSQRTPPPSPLAPEVTTVTNNSWVHQPVFLIAGTVGETSKPVHGTLSVTHPHDGAPPTSWEVCESHFKAIVYLQPGPNLLRLEYHSSKPPGGSIPHGPHMSLININYLPSTAKPPLQLAIIVAKDSPMKFDTTPARLQTEGNDIGLAIRKFKMAAYLWQVFTGEQMNRQGFGRRCFRFDEEWQPGSLFRSDVETGQMRNEAKIHIIRSDKTVAQIRDLDVAQQYEKANEKGKLFEWASEAVKSYFHLRPGQKHYVSCLLLDSHWDPKSKVIRGHAALGGGDNELQIGIFGSHLLYSYPSCLEDVQPAFNDCTPTDSRYVANDLNEAGSNWEAANIGIGAHMHETGHLFGCPHQVDGVMMRDYVTLNRTFNCRESQSTRTKSNGLVPVLQDSECAWHRLDCLRFRFHPCFRLPHDRIPINCEDSVQVWSTENNTSLATSSKGIAFIELYTEGDELCSTFQELFSEANPVQSFRAPGQFVINETELRNMLPQDRRQKRLKLEIYSIGQGKHTIEDVSSLHPKNARLKLQDGRWGFRGGKLGFSVTDGSQPQELILDSTVIQTKLLMVIRVHHGLYVDGLEFVYEDTTSQLFGKRGGGAKVTEVALDTRKGEILMGFYIRAGAWIDGIQIITSALGGSKKSQIFGSATGGSGHMLIPPRGYTIAGIHGSCGSWLDGFGLIITR